MCGRNSTPNIISVEVFSCETIEDLKALTVLLISTSPRPAGSQLNIPIEQIRPWPQGAVVADTSDGDRL